MQISFEQLGKLDLLNFKIILLYGNDSSMLERAINYIVYILKKKNILAKSLTEAEFKTYSPQNSNDLFATKSAPNLLIIDSISEKAKINLQNKTEDWHLFASTKIKNQSSLVRDITGIPSGLVIRCYPTHLTLFEIQSYTSEQHSEITSLLQKKFRDDYLEFINWLKLFNIDSASAISLLKEDKDIATDIKSLDYDDICLNILKRDPICLKNLENYTHDIYFIRLLTRYFRNLYELKILLLSGVSQQNIFTKCSEPVFFKHHPIYQYSLTKWTASEIIETLKKLTEEEIFIKSSKPLGLNPFLFQKMSS